MIISVIILATLYNLIQLTWSRQSLGTTQRIKPVNFRRGTWDEYFAGVSYSYREYYYTNVAWTTKETVLVWWLNRIQNVSIAVICDAVNGSCTEVSLLIIAYSIWYLPRDIWGEGRGDASTGWRTNRKHNWSEDMKCISFNYLEQGITLMFICVTFS